MGLEHPLILFLISPVLLLGYFLLRRGSSKLLAVSRVLVLSLLVIALASPYTTTTRQSETMPRITVLEDNTRSMELFQAGLAGEAYNALKTRTTTTRSKIEGETTALGDWVLQHSQNNNLLLVSDLNNNLGKDLADAITFASRTGTRVYALKPRVKENDLSLEIQGPKNLVIGNPTTFTALVRQAGTNANYKLEIQVDGRKILEKTESQTERARGIHFTYTFTSLGGHRITGKITPLGEDHREVNNVFYKAVFVSPKPRILFLGDTTSPLYSVLTRLYQVETSPGLASLQGYKAVVLDDLPAPGEIDLLRSYLTGGGGLVVVGGENSYNFGGYNNSEFERILPVISRPGEFRGGRNVVIVIDASGSTLGGDVDVETGEVRNTVIGEEDAIAINMVRNLPLDTLAGAVAFGGVTEIQPLARMTPKNKQALEDRIREFAPVGAAEATRMQDGLREAGKMLHNVTGRKEVIVLSDGKIGKLYNEILAASRELIAQGATLHFVQVKTESQKEIIASYRKLAQETGSELIAAPTGTRPLPQFQQPQETPPPEEQTRTQYTLTITDGNHFITRALELDGDLTGFNDVIPKLGSKRLVATGQGKPVLTVWNFGLGRVASLTTDDGRKWAGVLYQHGNTRLISATLNWAIGDPRPQGKDLVEAKDTWQNTPTTVKVISDTLPSLKLDGKETPLTREANNIYTTTLTLTGTGFHDLSGYPLAVNYPLEYRLVGFNDEMGAIIDANGGRVFQPEDIPGIFREIQRRAIESTPETRSLKPHFLFLALGIFLLEVITRRFRERIKIKHTKEILLKKLAEWKAPG